MQLKSLEIKGFKSFADKTIVSFDQGVTGIIGPNGCGKSNIIDSIRWVIGEQKISSLRSENLEALIFNGSKTRNPSGLAEVALTFENTKGLLPSEFTTITVSRRFYKNGESEYRLNDVQCRLKDIQNLFLDTGISTDSYAIIELGMVDEIIKDANSRRRMLEQAAGITIYKTRKKEAKNKLDATEQDLARIEDLVFEINNQLKSLENQAKKAEKYFEVKKEYRNVSIELAKASLAGFNTEYNQYNKETETLTDQRLALTTEITTDETAIEAEKLAFIESEQALQIMQQSFNTLINNLRTAESNKSLLQQKLDFIAEKKEGVEQFLLKSEGQLKSLEEHILYTQKNITDETETLKQLEISQGTLQSSVNENRLQFDNQRSKVEEMRNSLQQLQHQQFDAEKQVAVADTAIANIMASLRRLEEDTQNRESQRKQCDEELQEKQAQIDTKKNALAHLKTDHENLKIQIFETQQRLENLRQNLNDENRKLDSKKNEYALLKNLIDSMEGYPESVKYLHAQAAQWNEKASILSDVLYVKEGYRAALENVLEPYLNYYIANNTAEAINGVKLLQNNKKGKANFFILNKITGHTNTHNTPANTIAAIDMVEYDGAYANLIQMLLKNVYIANADNIEIPETAGVIIIAKNGSLVQGQYTISGGSTGIFEGNKIGRAKNIEKLAEAIKQQQTVSDNYKAQISHMHQQVVIFNSQLKEQEIRQLEAEINTLEQAIYNLNNKIEQAEQILETNKERIEEYTTQMQGTNMGVNNVRNNLANLMQQKQQVAQQLNDLNAEFKITEATYNQALAYQNEYNINLAKQQNKVQNLQQELQFKLNQINELNTQIDINTAQLKMNTENSEENADALQTIVATLTQLLQQKTDDEIALGIADQAYYNMRNTLQNKEALIRTKAKNREQIDHALSAIKDKVGDMKLHLAGMKERLYVEFRIDLDDIINEERKSEEPIEELKLQSEKYKKRIENIGEINPTAVEAYEEMKKRYDFIITQKTDLVNAKDSLIQTIAEVEATANQKFLDTYNAVRENFKNVFKALFTDDDTADLVMDNPDNLSETGIDIVARPKGKRPSSIGQLSGGERTLTATALLFAIYLIKPAPFCILDEVDAPLDDANVGKFTQMIRKFSDNSQFIIVTHNKQTMAAVDVIYGVTMQEPGVSRLVPVDFRNLN